MSKTAFVLFMVIFAALGSELGPYIDENVDFGPYEYLETAAGSKKNVARLNFDRIFSGFNLSFSYMADDSGTFVPVTKHLGINKAFELILGDFITVKLLANYWDIDAESIGILYTDSITLLNITNDRNLSTIQKNFSDLSDISCNDFIYPIDDVIMLNCRNLTKNELTLGYFNLTTNAISYYPALNPINIELQDVRLDEFTENSQSYSFWRYYTTKAWVIEEWEIENSQVILVRTINYTDINSSWRLTELKGLQGYTSNVVVLSNLTDLMLIVRFSSDSIEVLGSYSFNEGFTLTKVKITEHRNNMFLVAQGKCFPISSL